MSDAYSENAAMEREADAARPALGKEWYARQIDAAEEFEVGAGGVRQADYQAKLRRIATLWHHWRTPYFQDKGVNTLFSISDRVRAEHPDWDFDRCSIEAKRLFIDAVLRGEI